MIKALLLSTILSINLATAQKQGRRKDPLAHEGLKTPQELKAQGWSSEQWFSTQLDHFDNEVDKWFDLRYWYNEDKFEKETGPIIIYICGEWTCIPPDPSGAAMAYGQEKKGLLVALEHRYYGASQPFEDWSTPNLKWLNTTQALEDIHHFINFMKITLNEKMDRKVMIVGGSYPGAVVAWYQHLYDDVTMVWSSSGVVHAIDDFHMFDYDIYDATNKSEGCKEQVKSLTNQIDDVWDSGDKAQIDDMLTKFQSDNLDVVRGDFMFYIADIFTMGVQYGTRTQMCELITSQKFTDDPFVSLYEYGKTKGVSVGQYDAKSLRNTTYDISLNLRQWTYQYCTEFAWYQTPNDVYPLRSPSINLTFWHDYCQRIFDPNLPYPAVDETNHEFGGLDNKGKRIFFFNANEDPWQYAGLTHIADPAQHPDQVAYLINCTNCAHCIDLHTPSDNDPESLKAGREQAIKQLDEWYNANDQTNSADKKDMFLF